MSDVGPHEVQGGREVRARILVIEDDSSIALGLRMNLEAEGYHVAVAEDGEAGLRRARGPWDLIVLDVMLPRINGFEIVKTLRGAGVRTPIILLSARNAEMDKVLGLELGAEDYVTKPFSLAELLARVRVALRRGAATSMPSGNAPAGARVAALRFGDVEIDVGTREVRRGGALVEMTAKEFDILVTLYEASGRVLTRQQIFDAVWGPNHHGTPRTIDNFVAQLRTKLEADPAAPRHLLTVRGVGYRLLR